MRQVTWLSAALAAALVGAWFSWTAAEVDPKDADKVAVYRADKTDVQRIMWKSSDTTVTVERKTDDLGPFAWVTVTETPAGGAEKKLEFKGNEAADTLWESFGPLLALRELDTTNADRAVFGFAEPFANIEVTRTSGALALVVGGETWGAKDRYVEADKRVFLVDDADLKPLQFGKTRLMERNLHPLETNAIERVTLKRGTEEVAFVQQNASDPQKAFWARSSAPDTKDATGSTWVDKVLKLKLQSYPTTDEVPADLQPAFQLVFSGKGKDYAVDVLRAASGSPDFYARSAFARGTVKLTRSMATDAAADLDTVFAPPAPAAATETPPAPASPAGDAPAAPAAP